MRHAKHVSLAALIAGALLFGARQPVTACPPEPPLVAEIGWSYNQAGPWNTLDEPVTTSCGTKIYFHAMANTTDPITNYDDWDIVDGQEVRDTANYRWDWNWHPDGDMGDTGGYAADKTYNKPGDRVVRLYVYDTDGAGYTDDLNKADTLTIKVKLTLETDCMAGVDGQCTAEQHAIYHGNLANGWAAANYTLGVDGDHDEDCTHHSYIGDELSDAQIVDYLDAYENQSCHLYLMGGHRYKQNVDNGGATWRAGQENALGMVFGYSAGGLTDSQKTCVALHENACHDLSVGSIGHCASAEPCACKINWSDDDFCASCVDKLKAAQDLEH